MKNRFSVSVGLTALTFLLGCAAEVEPTDEREPDSGADRREPAAQESSPRAGLRLRVAPDRHIVVFHDEAPDADRAAWLAAAGARAVRLLDAGVALVVADADAAARIAADARVAAVGPEGALVLPEAFSSALVEAESASGGAGASGPAAEDDLYALQWGVRRVGAPELWAAEPRASGRAAVAVIDTGVADDHPDLAGLVRVRVATNYCRESGGPAGSEAYPVYATRIDFTAAEPPEGCSPAPSFHDTHGTHVAGTIAARFGGGRVVGVAPGAEVAAYKVFDRIRYRRADGTIVETLGAFDGPIFAAVLDAAKEGYGTINMSLGGLLDREDARDRAAWLAWRRVLARAHRAGALVVAAAGNSGTRLGGRYAHVPSDLPTVLAVSATGAAALEPDAEGALEAVGGDVLAPYSNFGSSIDLGAPGGDCGWTSEGSSFCELPLSQRPAGWHLHLVLSTAVRADGAPTYGWLAGTSMASPHAAAAAALVRAMRPGWTPARVRAWLGAHADPVGPRASFGAGVVRVDALASD